MAMTDWWAGLTPVETVIDCADARHRLRWAAGALMAVDHDDPEGERALAAIGGTACACIEALDAWAAHSADLQVLVLAPRGPSEGLVPMQQGRPGRVPGYSAQRLGALAVSASSVVSVTPRTGGRTVYRGVRPMRPGAAAASPRPQAGPAAPGAQDEVIGLLRLAGGLPERLIATVVAHWSARLDAAAAGGEDPDLRRARSALTAALYGRAAAAVRAWLRDLDIRVTLTMLEPGTAPSLARAADGVALALPFSWLPDVWSRGMATVLDRFCLSASMVPKGDRIRWELDTVGPDGGDVAPITIECPAS